MRKILLSLALAASLLGARAQNKATIESVVAMRLQNSGSVVADGQIKGYYMFFQSDKVDRKTNEYALQLFDANLNTLKTVKFTDDKDIVLMESSYNGNALMFMFYNDDQRMLTYRAYNIDGTKSYEYSRELDKKSNAYFKVALQALNDGEETDNSNLYNVNGRGFMALTPLKEDRKMTYEITFYGTDKRRTWTFNPIETGKYQAAQYLGNNDSIAVFEILSKDKLLSSETNSTLIGIDMSNGHKLYEMPTMFAGNTLYPMNIAPIRGTQNVMLIGPYYNGDGRVLQDRPAGLGVWVVDPKGKVLESKYNPYDGTLSRYVKVNSKGQVSNLGYIYIHNILQTEDGNFFAVGEGYHKVANAGGIAMAVLSGGRSAGSVSLTKLKITDLLTVQLNNKFELTNATIYEKTNNNFNLPGQTDFLTAHTMAMAARAYGAFDYRFTQVARDNRSFTTGYMDYEKSKDYKGLVFKTISYNDGKITNDQVPLKTDATTLVVFPAKPGFIMIAEYFKKKKKVELRLEKIN
ncbi:DUF6770 family protein [Flaviaesturariibacter terrae]